MEIEKIIYEEHDGVIETGFKKEYIGMKGIWALYGKESENSDYVCLNVGKANNVGLEIIYDLGCFHYISFSEDGTKRYINQLLKGNRRDVPPLHCELMPQCPYGHHLRSFSVLNCSSSPPFRRRMACPRLGVIFFHNILP